LDTIKEPKQTPPHPVRVGDPVAAKPFAEIFRLSNVEHRVRAVSHEIHPRRFRQLTEEIPAQSFDQRLRIGKKAWLSGTHGARKHHTLGQIQSNLPGN
jgi:hypothetical protein